MTASRTYNNQGFRKVERLKSSKTIERTFEKGASVSEYPFKFIWLPTDISQPAPVQTCFAVPKRKIRHATARNLIKRRVRESFRLQKGLLYRYFVDQDKRIALVILFTGKPETDYATIDRAMLRGMEKLIKQHAQYQTNI